MSAWGSLEVTGGGEGGGGGGVCPPTWRRGKGSRGLGSSPRIF